MQQRGLMDGPKILDLAGVDREHSKDDVNFDKVLLKVRESLAVLLLVWP